MGKENQPNIIDITIKEGGFRIHHRILPEQVSDLTGEMQQANLKYAEISHGCGIGALDLGYTASATDKELLSAARKTANDLQRCVYIYPSIQSLPKIEPLLDYFELGRVGVNINEVEMAKEHIQKLSGANKTVIGQLLRAHLRPAKEAARAAKKLADLGCEVIYLSDSFGSMAENEVEEYLAAIQKEVPLPVGFQGRNNTGRAMANTLRAYQAGAQWLDASLLGMGLGAGVASLEILVGLLQAQGLRQDLLLGELAYAAKHYALAIFAGAPAAGYTDLMIAKHKVDFYPKEFLLKIADILDLDLEELFIGLREMDPNFLQLRDEQLRKYLGREKLDLDVVLKFIKTGKIPHA